MAAADYWSQAQTDPAYIAAHGGNRQSLVNLMTGYGDASQLFARPPGLDPATGQPYKTLAEQYGIGQNDVSAAAGNPYSTQAQLAQQLSGDRYGITNTAAAHGAEFSGANVAAQAHENQNAGQRNFNAQQALTQQIAGITGNDLTSLTGAYNTITTNQLNTPVAPVAPQLPAPNMIPPQPDPGQTYLPGGGVTGPAAPAASPGPREYIPPAPIKPPKPPAMPKVGIPHQ